DQDEHRAAVVVADPQPVLGVVLAAEQLVRGKVVVLIRVVEAVQRVQRGLVAMLSRSLHHELAMRSCGSSAVNLEQERPVVFGQLVADRLLETTNGIDGARGPAPGHRWPASHDSALLSVQRTSLRLQCGRRPRAVSSAQASLCPRPRRGARY